MCGDHKKGFEDFQIKFIKLIKDHEISYTAKFRFVKVTNRK